MIYFYKRTNINEKTYKFNNIFINYKMYFDRINIKTYLLFLKLKLYLKLNFIFL